MAFDPRYEDYLRSGITFARSLEGADHLIKGVGACYRRARQAGVASCACQRDAYDLRGHQAGGFNCGKVSQHCEGGAAFHHLPGVHDDEAFGVVCHHLHVMTDHDHGGALLVHLADEVHHGAALVVVEAGGGLVEHQHRCLHHGDGGQRQQLPGPAVEQEGVGGQVELEDGGDGLDAALCLIIEQSLGLEAKGQLVVDGIAADLRIRVLEEKAHLARSLAHLELGGGCAVEQNLALVGLEQAVDEAHRGRLACSVGAGKGYKLAVFDGEGHAAQDRQPSAIRGVHVSKLNHESTSITTSVASATLRQAGPR